MTTSEGGLCNIALARIGQLEFIETLNENTAESQACARLYPNARDTVLALHPWGFATRRKELAVLTETERSGWDYAYSLPADCLTARYLWSGMRTAPAETRISFAIEYDATASRILLTDQEDAELVYTARLETVALYPPLFVEALAWKLAADLALALPKKPALAAAMDQGFLRAMLRAAAMDFRQAQEDVEPDSEIVRVR